MINERYRNYIENTMSFRNDKISVFKSPYPEQIREELKHQLWLDLIGLMETWDIVTNITNEL